MKHRLSYKILIILLIFLFDIISTNELNRSSSTTVTVETESFTATPGNSPSSAEANNESSEVITTEIFYPRNISKLFKADWSMKQMQKEGEGENFIDSLTGLKKLDFSETSGALLVSVINEPLVSENKSLSFDSVHGEMIIRDGIYTNVNSVRYFVYGIYEYKIGLATLLAVPILNRFYPVKSPINITEIMANKTDSQMVTEIKSMIFDYTSKMTLDFNATQNIVFDNDSEEEKYQSMIFTLTAQFENVTSFYNPDANKNDGFNEFNEETEIPSIGSLFSPLLPLNLELKMKNILISTYRSKWMNYIVMVSLSSFVQIVLTIRQMEFTNTQSGASKVSILTIGMQTIIDAYLCLLHLTAGVLFESIFNAFATAAFFQFVTFSLFEMRYLLIILKANRPQAFTEGWVTLRREFSIFYLRFYTFLITGLFIMYYFSALFSVLLFAMYSFWIPQIYSNAKKSVRRPFIWKYVIGISLTRLLIPLYFYGCPSNFIPLKPNYYFSWALVIWMCLQVSILWFQSKFGPQFFIPKKFLPAKYQYVRPISQVIRNREAGQNCVICMNDVEESAEYMITPCEHLFHSKCLQQWMEFKMECPTCRTPLPP